MPPMRREGMPAMTDPRWTPEQILHHMRLPGADNIYVLGCTERRRVTMGSQQIRAVNLIHAIATKHYRDWQVGDGWHGGTYPGWKPKVLIVGGSAGGLTAAAHAAYRGATVTLVEKENELMPNLVGSERLLHPRIYEWGSPQPFDADATPDYWKGARVGIPLLDWAADDAKAVRAALQAEWNGWQKLYGIDVRTQDMPPNAGPDWPALPGAGPFDHIVLAVGFGRERRVGYPDWIDGSLGSYWRPDDLPQRTGNILICGNGDGALTDLFRASLRGFSQHRLVDILADADPDRALESQVLTIERALESHPDSIDAEYQMARAYLSMRAPRLDTWTEANLRDDVRVWLSVRPTHGYTQENAFTRAAFPLNRLILASVLRVASRKPLQPVEVIYTKETLPIVPPGDGPHHLVFRVGVEMRPAHHLLPLALRGLDELERRNRDKSEGDITRQPIWPFFGEAIDPTRLPSAQAFVPALKGSEDDVVVEYYRDVHAFECVSEAFDSVFQAAADEAFSEADATGYFRGVMRFYMLAFGKILLTDAQVWDGRFVLRLPQLWESISQYEKNTIKTKFEIRERPHAGLAHVRDALYLRPAHGKFRARPFESSLLGASINKQFAAWSETDAAHLRDGEKPSAESILRQFQADQGLPDSAIAPILESWAAFDRLLQPDTFARHPWPSPRRTRYWNVGLQLESPGAFHAALSPRAKPILEEAFHRQRQRPERGPITAYLQTQITQVGAGEPLAEEIAQIMDWFDRAYNRMTVKNQGANVFSALLLGNPPGSSEEGTREKVDKGVSILKLGQMDSAGFETVHRMWEETKKRKGKESMQKPVTGDFWRGLFDELADTLSQVNSRPEMQLKLHHASSRVIRKMEKYSSIDNFRVGWVGDLEYGQPGELAARVMKTEGQADARGVAPDESQTEAFPHNPLG
jgi:hypothetical protein